MFLSAWVRNLISKTPVRHRQAPRRRLNRARMWRHGRCSLALELLENRAMLTAFLVDTDSFVLGDNLISLQEAVVAADGDVPFGDAPAGEGGNVVDTIEFDSSVNGRVISLDRAELTINSNLTIDGPGEDKLTLSGSQDNRIFSLGTNSNLKLSGVTIANGSASNGGGIYNRGGLTIERTTLADNSANLAGGGIWNSGTLVVADSLFSNNSTVARNDNGNGGGIANTQSGNVTISNTTFAGNAAGTGGAIDNFSGFFGAQSALEISGGTFSYNSARTGGAIWSDSFVSIANSTLSYNSAITFGGGVHSRNDQLSVTSSTIANNTAQYGGGIDIWGSTTDVSASTITGNTSVLEGGAIENYQGTLRLTNSTVSGNSTNGQGGAIWNYGTVDITNATIAFNRADADGNGSGDGGGLFNLSSVVYPLPRIDNTIVAANSKGVTGNDSPDDVLGDLDGSSSHNLVGDAATAGGLEYGTNGNIVGNAGVGTIDITTVLDPDLADNGGPTLTHALVSGSPARNSGKNSEATDALGNALEYDQRGADFARIIGRAVDIGAYEIQSVPPLQLVDIDVKPGGGPNSINLASNGVIAVAILTTGDFDASQVDAGTVVFAGALPVHSSLEDADGDGDMDLVLHFRVQDTILDDLYAQLLADDIDGDGILDSNRQTAAASLLGATISGEEILGTDDVDLFLSGRALRDLLEELAMEGVL